MPRYKITIAYDGSGFHGWQRQVPPDGAELRTVQGVVREAIMQVVGQPVFVQGASRTDSGVHAMGQVAHFDAQTRIPVERIAAAINSRLPHDVEVRDAVAVPPEFDACSDAVEKQYRYRLWTSRHRPLGERFRVYHCWIPLDIEKMRRAAPMLVGEHDFAAFAAAGHGRETTVRTVTGCEVQEISDCRLPMADLDMANRPSAIDNRQSPEIHVVVRGQGFLYNMVRIIAGTLVAVGRGRFEPEHVQTLLADCKREYAGPTLPAQGLCLEWIRYPPAPHGNAVPTP